MNLLAILMDRNHREPSVSFGSRSHKPRQDLHGQTAAQAQQRIEICRQLLENPRDNRFWKRIVTMDEKWVYFVNHNRHKRWVDVLHFELVPNGRSVDADLYCEQLERVYTKLTEKYSSLICRKCVLLQTDNVSPHRARKKRKKLAALDGVKVLATSCVQPCPPPLQTTVFSV
ncbi:hypothetical protein LAZ67_X000896 [Cordylochernes scorpioides]|uniref:Transposase n=1 Tax=Cordylochernes scorpioides TaxID=51811 RepID=A0ABY6LT38_9ARAC|nr:hypothetical protein LAZ67_X000896 [Cordylochernes scorpioides]